MRVPRIVRSALLSALQDADATEIERQQAECLLLALSDATEADKPQRKPTGCELRKSVRRSSVDRLWMAMEDNHFDLLSAICKGELDTPAKVIIAESCARLVYSEICLRKSQRLFDAIER